MRKIDTIAEDLQLPINHVKMFLDMPDILQEWED